MNHPNCSRSTTYIERRYPEAGFVMVDVDTDNERRMIYAPSRDNEGLVLSTGNWGELTQVQRSTCLKALEKEFPGRKIVLSD